MYSHVLHIDDSGTKDYAPEGASYGAGVTRYFVFAGILATLNEASRLAQAVSNLKKAAFGADTVELKSNWLRMPEERVKRYLVPYGITDADLTTLVDDVYDAFVASEALIIACVVDKVHMRDRYGASAIYPPAMAFEVLMQRIQYQLGDDARCLVTMDDMTGKNPKGNSHKANLEKHFKSLMRNGSRLRGPKYPAIALPALAALKFASSAASQMIQLADLVAYNVLRQFVAHGEDWERPTDELPTYSYFDRLEPRFCASPNGQIQGYGVIKVPIINAVPWRRVEKK